MAEPIKDLAQHTMVFPTKLFAETGHFQGLSFDVQPYLDVILRSGNYSFRRRSEVEEDPSYKQLIPYAVFRHGDTLFTYRRGKLTGEERLRQQYSIGIGGHISVDDPNLFGTTYEEGLRREVDEEVVIGCGYKQAAVALLNDDTTEVGRVHFGVVHLFTLDAPDVRAREKSINECKFRTLPELRGMADKFENWSQICFGHIEGILSAGPQPA